MKVTDQILIEDLKINCHVGVPDKERAQSQDLLVSVAMNPYASDAPLNDDIDRTVDYYAVSLRIDELAKEKPRKLIETLAEDLAEMILHEFKVSAVSIQIKKFILPNARFVGVCITKEAEL